VLKSADGGLRAVPFPVDDPERIPAPRYYDEEFYKLELEHVWPHAWQMATRLERIPEVGDWVEYQNVGQSVIIVNTEGGVKAFYNACRHRAVPFAGGKGPTGKDVPNLTPTRLKKWSDAELREFLLSGITPDFDSADEAMAEVVRNTTSQLTPADLAAPMRARR